MPEREKASETAEEREKGLRKHRMSSSDCREERGSAPVHKSREREGSEHKRWTEEQRAAGDVYPETCWTRERQDYRECVPVNILTLHRHI